jgi:transcriptional regulator with XRE-family HTH domain
VKIGEKIKELRIQKSLTQEELADRAELSKGFISQLERDLTSPSIATLVDILQCLGTNLEEFFTGSSSEQVVFKKTDYFEKYDSELKNEIKWIIPNAQKNMMEPILLTLEPGGSTYPDNPHEGEEFGFVLSGSITLHIGNKTFKAKKGESFYFTASMNHYITASDKSGASLIWVSTPPSF